MRTSDMLARRGGLDGLARQGRQLLLAIAGALVLVLVVLAYEPVLRHGTFVWDDHVLAEADAPFRHASPSKLLTQSFWPEQALGDPYYRPLVLLSIRFDLALGDAAQDFHLTNVLLHLLGCFLVAFTARRLGARGGAAVVAALLFGLAPRLTESVAWISGRTDVIAGTLGLAALALAPFTCAATGARSTERPAITTARSLAAAVCLFGALLAKEVALAFVVALGVAAARQWTGPAAANHPTPRASRSRLVGSALTILGPLLSWFILRSVAIRGGTAATAASGTEQSLGAARRATTVLEAIARYGEMILDLAHPQSSTGLIGEPDTTRAVIGAIVVVVLVALWVRFRRSIPEGARVALTLAVVALLPVLHVVPITLAGSVAADRFLYLPLIGLVLAFAVLARSLDQAPPARAKRTSTALAAAAIALAALSFITTKRRVADYTDEARFWVHAAEHAHPHNTSPTTSLALIVQKGGAVDLACNLLERSDRILVGTQRAWLPTHKRTLESLVSCWARAGRYEDAVRLADDLARHYPTSGRVQLGLAFARLHVRDFDGATNAFKQALALDADATVNSALGKGSNGANLTRRVASSMLADIPEIRADATAFGSAETRPDKLAWARHLASLGRAIEAERAYLDIARDPDLPASTRQRAIDYVTFEGDPRAAAAVVEQTTSDIRRHALRARIEERLSALAHIEALRVRIERLATQ